MALEATHMRFAMDLKDKYQVKDLDEYISGSIYPDSRYITKIDRELTHPKDYMEWEILKLDDFKKGWHTHLLCDDLQRRIFREQKTEIFTDDYIRFGPTWVRQTTLKVLQDQDDLRHFDILTCLQRLECVEMPNGENMETVKAYNQIFIREYHNPKSFNLDNSDRIGLALGIEEDIVRKIRNQSEEYLKDESMMNFVHGIYNQMLERALSL